jgi:uncharacterized protein YegL
MGLFDFWKKTERNPYTAWATDAYNYLYDRAPDTQPLRTWASDKWNIIYEKLPDTAPARTWARDNWNSAYDKIPNTKPFRDSISTGLSNLYEKFPDTKPYRDSARDLFWNNRQIVLGGIAIAVALFAIGIVLRKCYNTRKVVQLQPQQQQQQVARPKQKEQALHPKIEFKTSLDVAGVRIETPKTESPPPKVTLTFCIDKSGSMEKEREAAVKEGIAEVLKSAQKVIDTINGASIEIAIVAFNVNAEVILEPTRITATVDGENSIGKIEQIVRNYKSDGGTKIITGLRQSVTQLIKLADTGPKDRDHHVILLSDGDENLDQGEIDEIHHNLGQYKAKFHAVGIGSGHRASTLQRLAPEKGKFTGNYINTADPNNPITIDRAIMKIYTRALSQFKDIKISTKQLAPGKWSVNGTVATEKKNGSQCDLGSLAEEVVQTSYLKIRSEELKSQLDLSDVKFKISFEDPYGRKGTQSFSWGNPNTIIDPKMVKLARQSNPGK